MKNGPHNDAIRKVVTDVVAHSTTIADIWTLFEAATLVAGADQVERQRYRRAFYSGAAASFELFRQIGEPGFEEADGVRRLETMQRELAQFAEDVKRGRA
jgi:hypothetical protein